MRWWYFCAYFSLCWLACCNSELRLATESADAATRFKCSCNVHVRFLLRNLLAFHMHIITATNAQVEPYRCFNLGQPLAMSFVDPLYSNGLAPVAQIPSHFHTCLGTPDCELHVSLWCSLYTHEKTSAPCYQRVYKHAVQSEPYCIRKSGLRYVDHQCVRSPSASTGVSATWD